MLHGGSCLRIDLARRSAPLSLQRAPLRGQEAPLTGPNPMHRETSPEAPQLPDGGQGQESELLHQRGFGGGI